ncbi:hypothetical protein NE865_11245 [Phthorimaea operculella]|nr:hypothetical protein NE865_11245 [Phthorimaea operculella]
MEHQDKKQAPADDSGWTKECLKVTDPLQQHGAPGQEAGASRRQRLDQGVPQGNRSTTAAWSTRTRSRRQQTTAAGPRSASSMEHQDKKQAPIDDSGWTKECLKDIPQQMNGSDCGMFACTFAEFAARNAPFSFTQTHMPYLRRKAALEILTGKLLL